MVPVLGAPAQALEHCIAIVKPAAAIVHEKYLQEAEAALAALPRDAVVVVGSDVRGHKSFVDEVRGQGPGCGAGPCAPTRRRSASGRVRPSHSRATTSSRRSSTEAATSLAGVMLRTRLPPRSARCCARSRGARTRRSHSRIGASYESGCSPPSGRSIIEEQQRAGWRAATPPPASATAALATASGAAPSPRFHAMMHPGDEFVAVRQLYGGSINQFSQSFKSFGWHGCGPMPKTCRRSKRRCRPRRKPSSSSRSPIRAA